MNTKLPGAAYDNKIYAKFSKNTIEKKAQNKKAFCEEFDIPCPMRTMLLGVTLTLSSKNNAELLADILEGILVLDIHVVVRGIGTEKFQHILGEFSEKHPKSVSIVGDSDETLRKIFAASDACFFFSGGHENEVLAQSALQYAALPVAPKSMRHIVEDYNPNQESGNGFLFLDGNFWSAFAAIVRANENFRFPYDWRNIQKMAIEQ